MADRNENAANKTSDTKLMFGPTTLHGRIGTECHGSFKLLVGEPVLLEGQDGAELKNGTLSSPMQDSLLGGESLHWQTVEQSER